MELLKFKRYNKEIEIYVEDKVGHHASVTVSIEEFMYKLGDTKLLTYEHGAIVREANYKHGAIGRNIICT